MILARFSRSDSACLAMARCISWGRSTAFTATCVTFTPQGSVCSSMTSCSTLAQPLALGEQLVEVGLAEDAAQGRLRLLAGGVEVVLDLHHRLHRVHHPEVDDRVHLHAHVVAGDHVLGRHVEHDRAQADAHHAVDGPGHDDEPRALGLRQQLAEAEDDAALVLVQDLHREQQPEHDEPSDDDYRPHHAPFRTRSVRPSTPIDGHRLAARPPAPSATPRQRSPCTQHPALGREVGRRPPPRCPIRPSAPGDAAGAAAPATTSRTSSDRARRHHQRRRAAACAAGTRSSGTGASTSIIAPEDHRGDAAHGQEAVGRDLHLGREQAHREQDRAARPPSSRG